MHLDVNVFNTPSYVNLKLENLNSRGKGLRPQLPESDPAAAICINTVSTARGEFASKHRKLESMSLTHALLTKIEAINCVGHEEVGINFPVRPCLSTLPVLK